MPPRLPSYARTIYIKTEYLWSQSGVYLLQAVPLLIVCILVAVYGLCQPYKSTAINVLEICVLSNFVLLLMLQSTQLIKDSYFVFPVPEATLQVESNHTLTDDCQLYSGVATVSWILLPFYYLPLLGVVVTSAILLINYLRLAITITSYTAMHVHTIWFD